MPARASSSGAASCAPASCTETAPDSNPGSDLHGGGLFEHHGVVDSTRRRAPRDPAPRHERRKSSTAELRRIDPQRHRRMLVVSRQHDFGAFAPGGGAARRPASAGAHAARPLSASTAANNSRALAPRNGAARALTTPLARALAGDAAGVDREVHLGLGSAARIFDLVRGRDQQGREARRQLGERPAHAAARARAAGAGTSADVPSAIARTAARSTRACAASSAASAERPWCTTCVHGERGLRQRLGARRMACATCAGCAAHGAGFTTRTSVPPRRTALAKSRADTGRLPARCSSRTASTPCRRPRAGRHRRAQHRAGLPPSRASASATAARSSRSALARQARSRPPARD